MNLTKRFGIRGAFSLDLPDASTVEFEDEGRTLRISIDDCSNPIWVKSYDLPIDRKPEAETLRVELERFLEMGITPLFPHLPLGKSIEDGRSNDLYYKQMLVKISYDRWWIVRMILISNSTSYYLLHFNGVPRMLQDVVLIFSSFRENTRH